jgi:hypothetical protein
MIGMFCPRCCPRWVKERPLATRPLIGQWTQRTLTGFVRHVAWIPADPPQSPTPFARAKHGTKDNQHGQHGPRRRLCAPSHPPLPGVPPADGHHHGRRGQQVAAERRGQDTETRRARLDTRGVRRGLGPRIRDGLQGTVQVRDAEGPQVEGVPDPDLPALQVCLRIGLAEQGSGPAEHPR